MLVELLKREDSEEGDSGTLRKSKTGHLGRGHEPRATARVIKIHCVTVRKMTCYSLAPGFRRKEPKAGEITMSLSGMIEIPRLQAMRSLV